MEPDDLVIRGGGMTMVATDRLLETRRVLDAFARDLERYGSGLRRRLALLGGTRSDLLHRPATGGDVARGISLLCRDADDLARRLAAAAEGYGEAERHVEALARAAAAKAAWDTGSFLTSPVGVLMTLLGFLGTTSAAALAALVSPGWIDGARGVLHHTGLARILCTTEFVTVLRLAVSSADNLMLGAGQVPRLVASGLDDDASGLFGLVGAARAFLGLTMIVGLLRETTVRTKRTTVRSDEAPGGFAAVADRIPSAERGGPQVRIERYSDGDAARWIVYVGGTVDLAIRGGREPFDLTSNVHAVARGGAASVRTTLEAMHEAGVGANDEVTLVGYSQGGLAANAVALAGEFPRSGVLTFGSPTGSVVLPDSVPNIAVEIAEDPIPALGGVPADSAHAGLRRTVVTHRAYAGSPLPEGAMVPAHSMDGYRRTAALMDRSTDPRLLAMRHRIARTAGGGTTQAETTLWRGERVPGAAPTAARAADHAG